MAQNVPASGFLKLICSFSCPSTDLTYLLPLHSLPPPTPRVPCWLGVDQSLVERLDEQSCTFSKTTGLCPEGFWKRQSQVLIFFVIISEDCLPQSMEGKDSKRYLGKK